MNSFARAALCGLAMLLLGSGVDLRAQESEAPPPRHGCFRGRPLPECQGFWIYELRGSLPLVNTTRQFRTVYADTAQFFGPGESPIREFGHAAALEVGYAWNRSEKTAVGGTLALEIGARTRYFVRARVRRWVGTKGVSVEALPGFFNHAANGIFEGSRSLGYTLGLRVNVLDQGFFGARYDVVNVAEQTWNYGSTTQIDPGGAQHGVHAVAGLSSVPALWGSGAVGIGFLAFLGIFFSTYD